MICVLYFWKISLRSLPFAILRMALDRLPLKANADIAFFKLLGCGKGDTFKPADADLRRWGLLICINEDALQDFDNSQIIERWRSRSKKEFRILLSPISAHGRWSRKEPFNFRNENEKSETLIAAITRAKISLPQYPRFLRAVPEVTKSLHTSSGLISAIGIGEAPIGLQGTFSIWQTSEDLRNFAYKSQAHVEAISATQDFNWYTEELFARFTVLEMRGSL